MPEHTSVPMTEDQKNVRDQLLSDGKAVEPDEVQPSFPELYPDLVAQAAELEHDSVRDRQLRPLPAHLLEQMSRETGGPEDRLPQNPLVKGSPTPDQNAVMLATGGLIRPADEHTASRFQAAWDSLADDAERASGSAHNATPLAGTFTDDQVEGLRTGALNQLAAEPTMQLLESGPTPALTAPPGVYGAVFQVTMADGTQGILQLPIVGWDSSNAALFIATKTGGLVTAESVCNQILDEEANATSVEVLVAGPTTAGPTQAPGQPARTQNGLIVPGV